MTFRIVAFDDRYDLSDFRSGKDELDRWLRDHAHSAIGQGTRTYLVVVDEATVVGYFSLVPHTVDREEAPRRVARGSPRQIPSILLAKLALREDLQGQRLGSALLVQALALIVDAARVAGGKLVVVDAVDEAAAAFYRHHDFTPLPNRPDRLVMKLSTVARALGLDWP